MEFGITLLVIFTVLGLIITAYEGHISRHILSRIKADGADLERYIPTFRYIKGAPRVGEDFTADHTVILVGTHDLVLCSVKRDLFEGDQLKEKYWKFIEKDFCRFPKSDIIGVFPYIRPPEEVEADKTPVADFLVNQTVGRLFGVSTKSVPYAAFIFIVMKSDPSKPILFGIPDGAIGAKTSFDFLGMILPETASNYLDYGSTALELLDIGEKDSPAARNAKRAVREIIASLEVSPVDHAA